MEEAEEEHLVEREAENVQNNWERLELRIQLCHTLDTGSVPGTPWQ